MARFSRAVVPVAAHLIQIDQRLIESHFCAFFFQHLPGNADAFHPALNILFRINDDDISGTAA
ncbi:hypothetical protein D3C81_2151900 [compost metagenome]